MPPIPTSSATLQSQAIARLRLPLALFVILIHSYGTPAHVPFAAMEWGSITALHVVLLLREWLSHVVAAAAVPTFFLISGHLFFANLQRWSTSLYLQKLRRRLFTLLLPYVVWNLIAVIIAWLKLRAAGSPTSLLQYLLAQGSLAIFWNAHVMGHDGHSWLSLPTFSKYTPADVPLWYVRDLFMLVLLSPLLHLLLRRLGLLLPALLLACYALGLTLPSHTLGLSSLFFYVTGAALSLGGRSLQPPSRLCGAASVAVALVLSAAMLALRVSPCPPPWPILLSAATVCAWVMAFFALATCAVRHLPPPPRWLSQSSFFVYASHTLLPLPLAARLVSACFPGPCAAHVLLRYVLTPALTLLFCLVAYALWRALRRIFTPRPSR